MQTSSPVRPSLSPGGLIKFGETFSLSANVAGHLVLSLNRAGTLSPVTSTDLAADTPWSWQPSDCSQFLATFITAGGGR